MTWPSRKVSPVGGLQVDFPPVGAHLQGWGWCRQPRQGASETSWWPVWWSSWEAVRRGLRNPVFNHRHGLRPHFVTVTFSRGALAPRGGRSPGCVFPPRWALPRACRVPGGRRSPCTSGSAPWTIRTVTFTGLISLDGNPRTRAALVATSCVAGWRRVMRPGGVLGRLSAISCVGASVGKAPALFLPRRECSGAGTVVRGIHAGGQCVAATEQVQSTGRRDTGTLAKPSGRCHRIIHCQP